MIFHLHGNKYPPAKDGIPQRINRLMRKSAENQGELPADRGSKPRPRALRIQATRKPEQLQE